MPKLKITLATVGHMPANFNKEKIKEWKSSIFEIDSEIESYTLTTDSDGPNWEYTDKSLETILPKSFSSNFLIAIVNVPLELNWYSRRLTSNRVVFSFHEIKEFLKASNIPLENAIFRLLYAYTLLYLRSGNQIPTGLAITNFTHDETRGCLFDMNGLKSDIVYSLNKPRICPECTERLLRERTSHETIEKCQEEIKKIQKPLFYQTADYIKEHPIISLTISASVAIILGVISSIFGSYLWELIRS